MCASQIRVVVEFLDPGMPRETSVLVPVCATSKVLLTSRLPHSYKWYQGNLFIIRQHRVAQQK